MLKKSPSFVLASFSPSTLMRSSSEIGSTAGAFPFAKIHWKGERPTRSAVCTSSGLHSLRPCLGPGASQGEEAVLADSGRKGEISAGVGRVRSLDFLSFLPGILPLPEARGRMTEFPSCHNSFPKLPVVSVQTCPPRWSLPSALLLSRASFHRVRRGISLADLSVASMCAGEGFP